MADTTTVVEGKIKFREGKKWKPRWCVLKKPSPVADRLQALLYKDLTEYAKNEAKPKSAFALDSFFGLDAGFTFDREAHVLAIICLKNTSLMAFELRENMIQFEIKIRQSMGEEHQFPVKVVKAPSSCRLPKEPVRMVIHGMRFCLIAQIPPKILLSWNIEDLRRFGAREGKFCFEGGTRCGKGSGVFAVESEQAEDIADIVNLASTGKLANCHRKFKNRRRLSQAANQEMVNEISYTTLVVPVDITLTDQPAVGGAMTFDVALPTSSQCESRTSSHDIKECTNPAKTVLRPRSGQEYVVVQRKPVPSPNNSTGLSSHSPFLNSMFSYDLKPRESSYCSHQNQLLLPLANSGPQQSPSISSTAETVGSLTSSMHFHSWEPGSRLSQHGQEGRWHTTDTTDVPSQASPHPKLSYQSTASASPNLQKSACTVDVKDSIFFPMDMSFNASPPSSPLGYHIGVNPAPHTPIYVNQVFVDKHHNASSSTISSYSSASPIKAGVHSLMSLIFKDPSRHYSPSEPNIRGSSLRLGRTRSRHSESDANKVVKLPLSLSSSKPDQSFTRDTQQWGHTDSRTLESGESLVNLPPLIHLSSYSKVHQKEYDKFADSSIISRRRRTCLEASHNLNNEVSLISSSTESFPKDISSQNLAHQKSSGYKNIDCINAAAVATVTSPRSLSSGPDASHVGHMSQLENILESQVTPKEASPSNRNSVFTDNSISTLHEMKSVNSANPIPLPPKFSPPPLMPRHHSLFSQVSSSSLNSVRTSSDSSDSPPSYFAPSPPSTPPPPALPPRIPLIFPPSPSSPSTQPEPETASCSSEEEQELNYIEIDMTKLSAEKVLPPPPHIYSRRSKRARQQKEKDYAKLRYAIIDHRATRALQQTRQEHEKCRDGSLRHTQPKDINSGRNGVHLNRINSAPASSRRKQFSLQRERKLSSGSIESF